MTYVIAENHAQFLDFCRRHNLTPFVEASFIDRPEHLHGLRLKKHQIVMAGTWFARPDARALEAAANNAISKARR